MDRFNIYLQDGNVLDAKVYTNEPRNSFIFGASEEISRSLRKMHYNQMVSLIYYIKNDKKVKKEPIEISVGRLMKLVGVDYIACGEPKIYFYNSLEDLIDGLG